MNDFLKNLRGGAKDKRMGSVRGSSERRVDVERRMSTPKHAQQPPPPPVDTRVDDIVRSILNIETSLRELKTDLIRPLVASFERQVQLEERKIKFLENLFPYLENIFSKSPQKLEELKETLPIPSRRSISVTAKTENKTTPQVKRRKAASKRGKAAKDTGSKKINDKLRAEILEKIYELRREGKSFEQITKILVEEKVPTLSSRGQWHAQTVHRLCRGMDEDAQK